MQRQALFARVLLYIILLLYKIGTYLYCIHKLFACTTNHMACVTVYEGKKGKGNGVTEMEKFLCLF